MMTRQDELELRFFAKHCLFLHCTETHIESGQSAPLVTSGFVVSVEDEWFFVTAGHCLEKIKEKRAKGVIYSDWALVDVFAQSRERPHRIDAPPPPNTVPFNIDQAFQDFIYDQKTGIDFGFIHLERPRFRRLLESNGVEPLEGVNCMIPPEIARDCDTYFLMGIPADQLRVLSDGHFYSNIVSIDLTLLPADDPEWSKYPNMLHASFPKDFFRYGPEGFNSFVGLSGGPIFGVKALEDGEHYCVVGIQSCWDGTSRIQASYLIQLTHYLEKLVKQVRGFAELRQGEGQDH